MIDKWMYSWTRKEIAEKLGSPNTYGKKEMSIMSLAVYQDQGRFQLIVVLTADKASTLSSMSCAIRNSIQDSMPTLKNLRTVWSPMCGGMVNSVTLAVENSSYSPIARWTPKNSVRIDGGYTDVISEI